MRLSATLISSLIAGAAAASCPYAKRSDAVEARGCPYAARAASAGPAHSLVRRGGIEGKKGIFYSTMLLPSFQVYREINANMICSESNRSLWVPAVDFQCGRQQRD